MVLLGLTVAASLVLAWRLAWVPIAARRSDEAIARWLEAVRGDHGAGVISAVQLADAGVSEPLEAETVRRTVAELETLNLAQWVPMRRLVAASRALGVSLLLLILVGSLSPDIILSAWSNLASSPSGRGDATRPQVVELPAVVTGVTLEIQAPPYTGVALRVSKSPRGKLEAMSGATVRILGRSIVPARGAILMLASDPSARWPVSVDGEGILKAVIHIGSDDRYRFALHTKDGRTLVETRWRSIVALPDAPPIVTLETPAADVEAHPGDQVSVVAQARDEFGLVELALVVETPAGERRRVIRSAKGARELRGEDVLAVDDLGLQPGERATFYVEAVDVNDVTGPGVGRSVVRQVLMADPNAEDEEVFGLLQALVDQLIEVLADRLESPIEDGQGTPLTGLIQWHTPLLAKAAALNLRLETSVAALGRASQRRDRLSNDLRKLLKVLSDVLSAESRQVAQMRERRYGAPKPSVLRALLRSVNADGVRGMEQGIFMLKSHVDQGRQEKVLNRGREMLSLQNELHELLKRLKEQGDPEVAREIQQHLNRLDKNLRAMEAQMRNMAERAPYENQNASRRPHDDTVNMQSMREKLAEAKRLVAAGKIDEAMKLLEGLNTQTQELMSSLNSQFQTPPPMTAQGKEGVSKVQKALQHLASEQRALLEQTQAAEAEEQAALAKELEARLSQLAAEAEALAKALREAPVQGLHKDDVASLESLGEKASKLAEPLRQGQLEVARQRTDEVAGGSEGLREEIGKSEERELNAKRSRQLKHAMAKLAQGRQDAKHLVKRIAALQGELKQLQQASAARKGNRRSKKLGQAQGALGKATRRLRKRLKALDGQVPGIEKMLGPNLESAGGEMEKASGKLKGHQPGAGEHQRGALDKLDQALKGLEKRLQESPPAEGQAGTRRSQDKVAIPDAEAYQAPKAFREELLKAMKERAPRLYEDEVKRFYEELVR